MSPPLLIRGARLLTLGDETGPLRGSDAGDLVAIDGGDVLVINGAVDTVGTAIETPPACEVIEANGRVVMPAFVDAHTHACWAGERYAEWEAKLEGASYLELLARGGGIMSTVRSVRSATVEQLTEQLLHRLELVIETGTTAIEVKSGYGLDAATELKMLRSIASAAEAWAGRVSMTACIGHAIDPDQADPVRQTTDETLGVISAAFPGITIDAYCESGAWSLEACLQLFDAARAAGHPVRVHADQFNDLGMIPEAISRGYRSVDHLEATTPEHLSALAGSGLFGVMLPASGFHLDGRYADGRAFIDAGGAPVIASNLNPGSAPCFDMATVIALSVRHNRLSPAEAIVACTRNAAALLGFQDLGRIAPGASADLILLRHTDERALAHDLGGRHIDAVFINGVRAYSATGE
ncbi:MAG: imidazolonepropionase [Planctomycetota bacterium]